jgi:hypothetical protein
MPTRDEVQPRVIGKIASVVHREPALRLVSADKRTSSEVSADVSMARIIALAMIDSIQKTCATTRA